MDKKAIMWMQCYVGVVGWQLHPKNGKTALTKEELNKMADLADAMTDIAIERLICRGQSQRAPSSQD